MHLTCALQMLVFLAGEGMIGFSISTGLENGSGAKMLVIRKKKTDKEVQCMFRQTF